MQQAVRSLKCNTGLPKNFVILAQYYMAATAFTGKPDQNETRCER